MYVNVNLFYKESRSKKKVGGEGREGARVTDFFFYKECKSKRKKLFWGGGGGG